MTRTSIGGSPRLGLAGTERQPGPAPADAVGQPTSMEGGDLAAMGVADEPQHLAGVGPDLPRRRAGPPAVRARAGVGGVVVEDVAAGHQRAYLAWRRSAAISLASTSASSPLRRSRVRAWRACPGSAASRRAARST